MERAGKSWRVKKKCSRSGPSRKPSGVGPRGRIVCLRREKYPQESWVLAGYWLEQSPRGAGWGCLVELLAGADSGRCWLELYADPSGLVGETSESRKERG